MELLQGIGKDMRFQKYIEEEYLGTVVPQFRRNTEVAVFKNPSKKEMAEAGGNGRVRFIVDFKNKNLYIAEAYNIIHNDILAYLVEHEDFPYADVSDDKFWDYCYAGFAHLVGGKFELTNNAEGQSSNVRSAGFFKYGESWLKQWFHMPFKKKIKGALDEEYFTRFGKWEIFTNPSWKELAEIERESHNHKTHGFIRFLLTKDLKTLYAFPASMLHGNAALVIDEQNGTEFGRSYEIHYYPLQGVWDDGVMLLDSSIAFHPTDEERELITKVMKDKFNIKVDFGAEMYKELQRKR